MRAKVLKLYTTTTRFLIYSRKDSAESAIIFTKYYYNNQGLIYLLYHSFAILNCFEIRYQRCLVTYLFRRYFYMIRIPMSIYIRYGLFSDVYLFFSLPSSRLNAVIYRL